METPEGNSRPWSGAQRRPGPHGTAGGARATVLGSLTIPGRPERVSAARTFVAQTLSSHLVDTDCDAATLLTSEIVTNAIQHTRSGAEGGTVTIVVIGISRGILVEIIDDGAAGAPVVKGDLYAAEGHGLFLVEHLASEWGYQRDEAGTTVWFHLPASYEPRASGGRPDRPDGRARQISADFTPDAVPGAARPAQFWAAAPPAATRA